MRLEQFLKSFFDGILDCDWRWHRFEWQSRCSIHGHGTARFKNDPGLCELTIKVYAGREQQKKMPLNKNDIGLYANLVEITKEGLKAEEIVITYTDTLLTAMNDNQERLTEVPNPHPCSLNTENIKAEDLDTDYFNLINCCQRHVCRLEGYCKSNSKSKKGKNKNLN